MDSVAHFFGENHAEFKIHVPTPLERARLLFNLLDELGHPAGLQTCLGLPWSDLPSVFGHEPALGAGWTNGEFARGPIGLGAEYADADVKEVRKFWPRRTHAKSKG